MRFIERTTAAVATSANFDYVVSPREPVTFAVSMGSGSSADHVAKVYGSLQQPDVATSWVPLLIDVSCVPTAAQAPYRVQGLRFAIASAATAYWAVLQGDNS